MAGCGKLRLRSKHAPRASPDEQFSQCAPMRHASFLPSNGDLDRDAGSKSLSERSSFSEVALASRTRQSSTGPTTLMSSILLGSDA